LLKQLAGGSIGDLPSSETAHYAARSAALADVEPPDFAVLVERKTHADITGFGLRFADGAFPLSRFGFLPVFFAVADETRPLA
jgi:hypothetical protein